MATLEHRAVIKFCVTAEKYPVETKKFLDAAIFIGQRFTIETTIGIEGLKMEILISQTLTAPRPPIQPGS